MAGETAVSSVPSWGPEPLQLVSSHSACPTHQGLLGRGMVPRVPNPASSSYIGLTTTQV